MKSSLSRSLALLVVAALSAVVSTASAQGEQNIPKPFVIAPGCTTEQRLSAIAVSKATEPLVACFFLEKWSFKGAALAYEPPEFKDRQVTHEEFRQFRKKVFREQSARLRTERSLAEALPGEPPAHASLPLSLLVPNRTPLGVFLNEENHIGFAELVPTMRHNDQALHIEQYPFLFLETWVYTKGKVFRLLQFSPISGPSTVGEGFRMADDWARRFNGGERLATED